MSGFPIAYDQPLFRPPSEAYSLILQVTLGCSWNQCAFCEMYTSKKFKIKPFEQVRHEIESLKPYRNEIKKVFLSDGNAMILSGQKLLNILEEINKAFPKINRISAYALPGDIISKSDEELAQMKRAGLQLIYVGIETGYDDLL